MDNLRITREQAHAMVAAGAKVIDVRSAEEFAAGAVPGAIHVPVQVVAAEIARYAQPSDTLVVYCKAGGRADVAVRTLRAMGYAAAFNLGGLSDW